LNAANTKASGLENQLADLNTKISEKDAEIKRLGDVAAGANGAGGKGTPEVGTKSEGAAGTENEFLSDVDKQVTAQRELVYGKENTK
jgi:hypothetical protein